MLKFRVMYYRDEEFKHWDHLFDSYEEAKEYADFIVEVEDAEIEEKYPGITKIAEGRFKKCYVVVEEVDEEEEGRRSA